MRPSEFAQAATYLAAGAWPLDVGTLEGVHAETRDVCNPFLTTGKFACATIVATVGFLAD